MKDNVKPIFKAKELLKEIFEGLDDSISINENNENNNYNFTVDLKYKSSLHVVDSHRKIEAQVISDYENIWVYIRDSIFESIDVEKYKIENIRDVIKFVENIYHINVVNLDEANNEVKYCEGEGVDICFDKFEVKYQIKYSTKNGLTIIRIMNDKLILN